MFEVPNEDDLEIKVLEEKVEKDIEVSRDVKADLQ